MLKALLYAYILGGLTFIPLVIASIIFITIYTSVPVGDVDISKSKRARLESEDSAPGESLKEELASTDISDIPRTRKGWLTMRRTFEESALDGGYVTLVRSFLDSRSKDPKRSRPKDMWYVVLKGKVLYLYEDEEMTECEAAVELGSHDVVIYPDGLLDGELFAKRNAICLKPKQLPEGKMMPSVTREMQLESEDIDAKLDEKGSTGKKREREREKLLEMEKKKDAARDESLDPLTPWFIFVRSNIEMEDWYFALIHASEHPIHTPTLSPLQQIFESADMNHLLSTLDAQPDIIPMRWLNALLGRIFFSYYRTQHLENYIIGRLMKKLSKVKRPAFLTDIVVREVSVGNKAPMFSKPMLKDLTKEGDASLEVHLQYKGEIRITVEATATINLGARFKSYTVKLVLAAVLKELEGNLLVRVKRPPSNRIWYAFTQTPRMVLEVEPIVSDRQITWGMILSTIESKFKEIIQESVVMPNMDDIAYFESSSYQRRGGIWADASRRQRPISPDVSGEGQSSAPALESDIPNVVVAVASDPALHRRSQSVDERTPEPLPSHLEDQVPAAILSLDDITDIDPSRTRTRRKSWFSSAQSGDAERPLSDLSDVSGEEIKKALSAYTEDQRARAAGDTTIRSQSSPGVVSDGKGPLSAKEILDEENDIHAHSHLSAHYRRRSTSQHSIKRDYEHESSEESDSSNTHAMSTPPTPRKISDGSQSKSNRSSSPPGFFSTLKSRAADKQALSQTAKEAMRKWSVNWNGLKKDMKLATFTDEGSTNSLSRSEGSSGSTHRPRANYAEVRAAVNERKEKEKHFQASDSSRPSSPNSTAEGFIRSRAVSNQSTVPPNESNSENGRSRSSSRASKPSLSTRKSSHSIGRSNVDRHSEDLQDANVTTPTTIYVQPQAKTMTIPGIHASHRGEVMSMGYVAPQSVSSSVEGKLKNPAIQSVYRLWKNPAMSAQEQEIQVQQQVPPQPLVSNDLSEWDGDITPSITPSTILHPSQPSTRPIPPPLPPRSTPIAVSRPVTTSNPMTPASSSSTASDVLKSIATKDENTRTQATVEQVASRSSPSRRTSQKDIPVDSASDSSDRPYNNMTPATEPLNPSPGIPPPEISASA